MAVISVRYNIINSIHNFASIESQNQYHYYIITILLVLLFLNFFFKSFLSFKIKNIFITLIITFTLCFLLNLLEGFKYVSTIMIIKINLLASIKMLLTNTILLTLTVGLIYRKVMLKNPLFLVLVVFFILNFNFLKLVDLFGLCLVLLFLKKSKSLFSGLGVSVKLVHTSLLFLLILTNCQIYNFVPITKSILTYNISIQSVNNFLISNQYSIFISSDFRKNIIDFTTGVFKNIFEKGMFNLGNNLVEIYSYNQQVLIQIYGTDILITLFVILLLFLNVLYLKKRVTFL